MVPRIGMTIDETADYTGIGRTTLRHLIRSGKIPTLKIGRKTIIRVDTMEYFLKINEGLNLLDNDEVRAVK
nr:MULTISPECIES: helix-turn-helix domain-containing protein [Filifactoraceae]